MSRTIIVGYGNIDREDDGVAYRVINALRENLGQQILEENDTGLEELGNTPDSIFLPQLLPEIMDTLTDYNRIVFVDAHVGEDRGNFSCTEVVPELGTSSFSHHMTPESILAFLHVLYKHKPQCYLISIRGYAFDFKRSLTPEVENYVNPAVEKILQITKG